MILVSSAPDIIGRELLFLLAEEGHSVRAMVPSAGGARHCRPGNLQVSRLDNLNVEGFEYAL
jgi:uncharacterized protein YbjT (DUF2867 family)